MAHQSGLSIDPVLPSLDLRCPECDHHFVVHKDNLGMAEAVVCPNCNETNAASDMVGFVSIKAGKRDRSAIGNVGKQKSRLT